MAASISPLSYISPSVSTSATPSPAAPKPGSATGSSETDGFDAQAQLQALQKQGNFQSFLNNSVAAALLQPDDGVDSGTSMTTMVNNMLQQVLGAYQSQMSSPAQASAG